MASLFTKVFPYDFKADGSAIVGIKAKRKIYKHGNGNLHGVCKGIYNFDKNTFCVTSSKSKVFDTTIGKDGYSNYEVLLDALDHHDWSDNIYYISKKGNVVWKRQNGVNI